MKEPVLELFDTCSFRLQKVEFVEGTLLVAASLTIMKLHDNSYFYCMKN